MKGINFSELPCLSELLCILFLDDYDLGLIDNPRFIDGNNGWSFDKREHGEGQVTFDVVLTDDGDSLKSNIKLGLTSNKLVKDSPTAIGDFYQTINVNGLDDPLILTIDSKLSEGGSNVFGGFSYWSGAAGYYGCFFDGNDTQLGCMVYANWSDNFDIIPIYVSTLFEVESTDNVDITEIGSGPMKFSKDIVSLLDNSSLSFDRSKVRRVDVGAFVTEFPGQSTPNVGVCGNCFADLEVIEINLRRKKL